MSKIFIIAGDDESARRGIDFLTQFGRERSDFQVVDRVDDLIGGHALGRDDFLLRMPGWSRHSDATALLSVLDDAVLTARGVQVMNPGPEIDPSVLSDIALLEAWLDDPTDL